ncbi:MAG: hypothetical protein R3F61_39065 [Myxococcota bacterium]
MGPELSLKKTMLLALVVMAVAWALWPAGDSRTVPAGARDAGDIETTARLEPGTHAGVVVDR